jgi:predicted nuclease of predicted toxin-antitoxin system
MRFKIDENLPEELAELLRDAGWDAATVVEQELGGSVDPRVSEICDSENRILVTFDRGFSNIKAYAPELHPGFVVFRLKSQDKAHVLSVTTRLIAALRQHELRHELWIVDETRIRVRASPS